MSHGLNAPASPVDLDAVDAVLGTYAAVMSESDAPFRAGDELAHRLARFAPALVAEVRRLRVAIEQLRADAADYRLVSDEIASRLIGDEWDDDAAEVAIVITWAGHMAAVHPDCPGRFCEAAAGAADEDQATDVDDAVGDLLRRTAPVWGPEVAADLTTRRERLERFEARVLVAIDALGEVLDDPELGGYERQRAALLDALEWLEIEVTCGDCVEGRCHWGGDRSRESIAAATGGRESVDAVYRRCGCARHEASVAAQQRRARLRRGGVGDEAVG
jgi:hypothetical protein